MSVRVGSHVTVGKSRRVHKLRHGTVWTPRGHFTTYCGYYGNPDHGWMRESDQPVTCRRCLAADTTEAG